MWLQQDGKPSHYRRFDHLDRAFPNRWNERGGPVTWPPRSSDLSPPDFFLWGAMKSIVTIRPSILKWTWWHEHPSLLLRSVKRPIFLNMSANTCRVDVVRAYISMAQFRTSSAMRFFISYYSVIKRFTLHSVLWPYCLCVSLSR
ncbi:hypothetical protein TNCV_4164081 [Trichonephila clavipes]|nr:hypothetical protein TNCV_4164081 [Trichonephila clavipes]